jgi:hypothetical protein
MAWIHLKGVLSGIDARRFMIVILLLVAERIREQELGNKQNDERGSPSKPAAPHVSRMQDKYRCTYCSDHGVLIILCHCDARSVLLVAPLNTPRG